MKTMRETVKAVEQSIRLTYNLQSHGIATDYRSRGRRVAAYEVSGPSTYHVRDILKAEGFRFVRTSHDCFWSYSGRDLGTRSFLALRCAMARRLNQA